MSVMWGLAGITIALGNERGADHGNFFLAIYASPSKHSGATSTSAIPFEISPPRSF